MSYDLRHRIHALRNSGNLSSKHNSLEVEIQEYLKNGGEFARDYYINHVGREFNRRLKTAELDHLLQDSLDASLRPSDLSEISTFIIEVEGDNGTETGAGAFSTGTSIPISSTPKPGYLFKNWKVKGKGSVAQENSASTQFTVGTFHSKVVANYTAIDYNINVSGENGSEKGSGIYNITNTVAISAKPFAGYKFKNWSFTGPGTISDPLSSHTNFKVGPGNANIVANYQAIAYNIKVSGLAPQSEGGTYIFGDTFPISAPLIPGYIFTEWSLSGLGNIENKSLSTTNFTVRAGSCEIIANYNKSTLLLNLTGDNGVETGAGQYKINEQVYISSTPNPGYKFKKWVINSGEGSIESDTSSNTIFITGSSSAELEATYEAIEYDILTSTRREADNTSVNNYTTKIVSNIGDTINISADSLTGFSFDKWIIKGSGTVSSPSSQVTTFVVGSGNSEIYASYSNILYNITTSGSNGIEIGSGSFEYLSTPGLTTTPDPGYKFLNWSSSDPGVIQQPNSPSTIFEVSSSDALITANYQAIDYTLTLIGDNGSSTGDGVYNINNVVNITATPNPGYVFKNWVLTGPGNLSNSTSITTSIVIGDGNCTIEAIYEAIDYTISTDGLNGTETGGGVYNIGNILNITAKAEPGYEFTSWSSSNPGAIFSTTSPKTKFTVGAGNALINANYTAIDYDISITGPNGSQSGSGVYNISNTITLTANPDPGYKFISWSKSGQGSISDPQVSSTTFIVGAGSARITAIYELIDYTVSIEGSNGTESGSGVYNINNVINITSTPDPGYDFTSWSITGQGSVDSTTSSSTKLTVGAGNCTIEAIYTLIDYSITTDGLNGTETPGPQIYNIGGIVGITAVPSPGYLFSNWSTNGDGSITNPALKNTSYIVNTSHALLTANYKAIDYLINFNSTNGIVNEPGIYNVNNNINLLATPDLGYEFVSWSKSGPGTITNSSSASTQFTVGTGDCDISATYNAIDYNITINGNNGTETPVPGVYNINNIISLTANPDPGYRFSHWSLSGSGVVSNSSVTNTTFIVGAGDATVTANYIAIPYSVSLRGQNGVETTGGSYIINDNFAIEAVPNPGYEFVEWTKSGVGSITNSNSASTNFTVGEGGAVLTANYSLIDYNISTEGNNGTETGAGIYNIYNAFAIEATGDTGYEFSHWSLTGIGSLLNSFSKRTIFTVGAGNATIEATYTLIDYTLTLQSFEGSVAGPSSFNYQEVVNISATPSLGYEFSHWNLSGPGSLGDENSISTTFTGGDGNAFLEAVFTPIDYTITINGSNTNSTGGGVYNIGDIVTISSLPDSGYEFESWSLSGSGQLGSNTPSTTFTVGAGNATINLSVKLTNYTITVSGNQGVQNGDGFNNLSKVMNSIITLSASPNNGYLFAKWVTDGPGTFTDPIDPNTEFTTSFGNDNIKALYMVGSTGSPSLFSGNVTASDQSQSNVSLVGNTNSSTLNGLIFFGDGTTTITEFVDDWNSLNDPNITVNQGGAVTLNQGETIQMSGGTDPVIPQGEEQFITDGTYTFIVPNNVNSISALAVGAGGGAAGCFGDSTYSGAGGGGGALSHTASQSVNPGDEITIIVGKGGTGGSGSLKESGTNGGNTIIKLNNSTILEAGGGTGGVYGSNAGTPGGSHITGSNGYNGGYGGHSQHNQGGGGGGGAAGYSGAGGQGGSGNYKNGYHGSGGGGGGGAGQAIGGTQNNGGGGVGIYGSGQSGSSGYGSSSGGWGFARTTNGKGGSGGNDGSSGGHGGIYGGGGGGAEDDTRAEGGTGGVGAARLIWGESRSYPSNNTSFTPNSYS